MLSFKTADGDLEFNCQRLIVAGWTARDESAVQHHIDELAELGVQPPSKFPLYYQVSTGMLTQAPKIEVLGRGTSGEVEPIIVQAEGRCWLGLGSDQTDRELEAHSVAHSKQICPKIIARELWSYDEVSGHLEQIELFSQIFENGNWTDYQSGTIAQVKPLNDLAAGCNLSDNELMMCGTFAAKGGVRAADRFKMIMRDPVLDRQIEAEYSIETLDIIT